MRIGIFGGTFDPIHSAHVVVGREAARQFGLGRVLFVPASRPPHKGGMTAAPYEDRYRMVEIACEGEPLFEASRLDAADGASYSIHLIGRLRRIVAPEDELYFIIGADAFAEIRTWYRWEEVVRAVAFIVVSRPGHRYEIPPGTTVITLKTVAMPVSSSEIRARLAAGEQPPEVPPAVLEYIRQRGLYGAVNCQPDSA